MTQANQQIPNNIVVVRCPNPTCNQQLSFKAVPNFREKPITCPKCHHAGVVRDFILVKDGSQPVTPTPPPTPGNTKMPSASITCVETGERYELKPGPNRIGRKTANGGNADILFSDPDRFMSRHHATITFITNAAKPQLQLRDEHSANGISIKGTRVPAASIVKLEPDCPFTMGRLTFVCTLPQTDNEQTMLTQNDTQII